LDGVDAVLRARGIDTPAKLSRFEAFTIITPTNQKQIPVY
jgi:hypothetical protein